MTLFEDVRALQKTLRDVQESCDENASLLARHDEQISGERGLSNALLALAREVASLRKAAYWVAGIIVAGSISFAFSVLLLVGHH
jgi:hypothetical protein